MIRYRSATRTRHERAHGSATAHPPSQIVFFHSLYSFITFFLRISRTFTALLLLAIVYLSVAKQQWNIFLITFPEIVLVLHCFLSNLLRLTLTIPPWALPLLLITPFVGTWNVPMSQHKVDMDGTRWLTIWIYYVLMTSYAVGKSLCIPSLQRVAYATVNKQCIYIGNCIVRWRALLYLV